MKNNKGHTARGTMSRQIIAQYVISIILYAAALLFFIFAAWAICQTRYWHADERLYQVLYWIQVHIVMIIGWLLAIGWLIISIHYIRKFFGFIDEIISESEKLTNLDGGNIQLPKELGAIQNELNLLHEKAVNSSNAAKEAEKRKNDLLVYLAHDLKTPLTSVIGYLTLLRDEVDISVEARAKYTNIALEKAERLEELINEFFEITQFNLTQISLNMEHVNFTRLVEQTVYEFNPILSEKNLTWDLSVDADIHLTCDADKLERVVDNIIKNAINYSYPGNPIKISLTKDEKNVIFVVENHGKTIPKEKLDRIFEQFFRLDSSRGTTNGGAGLGLAIAKEIIELHAGTISAESQNGIIKFKAMLPL